MNGVADPGIDGVKRSPHYPRVLTLGRVWMLAAALGLVSLFLIKTDVGPVMLVLVFLVFMPAVTLWIFAVRKVWRDIPASELWEVKNSAVLAVRSDLFRRKPPVGASPRTRG